MSCACRVIADQRHTTSGFLSLYSWFDPDLKIAHFIIIGAMSCACRVIADQRHTTSGFLSLYSWFDPDLKIAHFIIIGAKEVCNISILNSLS